MSNQVLAVVSLFALRLGVPLVATLARSMLLSRWDSRRAEFFAR